MLEKLSENIINDDIEDMSLTEGMQKYLTFMSDGLVYGITIENVMEIITNHSITMLPMVPGYVKGIINLRGQIVPVIDIKQRMKKGVYESIDEPCIIILEVNSVSIGILVDVVLQVIVLEDKLSPPTSKDYEFINGMANLPGGTVMFCLDCELLVNDK